MNTKRYLLTLLTMLSALLLAACGGSEVPPDTVGAPGAVMVEVGFLNHAPMRSVLADVDELLAGYGDKVSVTRYDFESPEGEAFAEAKELTGHTPIAIFVDGEMDFTVDGRAVKFYSFPQGGGTGVVPEGAWTMDDLKQVLDEATSK